VAVGHTAGMTQGYANGITTTQVYADVIAEEVQPQSSWRCRVRSDHLSVCQSELGNTISKSRSSGAPTLRAVRVATVGTSNTVACSSL